jgi:ABC-2 type transport system ATP-binding protein
MHILSIQNVVKQYKNHRAVDGVSFDMKKGTIFGMLGPNGAGKTSLIRIITSITGADEGQVLLDGVQVNQKTTERIGYMPEERGLYKKMKVGEHLIYLALLKGLSKQEAKKKIAYWLERFEIESWKDKKVQELSKGMQQKVQFIATVLHEPPLIILDEPFSGLDPVNTNIIKEEIRRLNDEGASIIFSTHRMESVEEICEDIVMINQGKIAITGNVQTIKDQFKENKYAFTLGEDPTQLPVIEGIELISNLGNDIVIQSTNTEQVNTFLKAVIDQGMTIKSFHEILPSINEIFIKLVGKSSINE